MKIKIGKSDKLNVPGHFESSGTTHEVIFDLPDTTDQVVLQQALAEAKEEFEKLYWPLVNYDFETFLQRLRMGTPQFLAWKNQPK